MKLPESIVMKIGDSEINAQLVYPGRRYYVTSPLLFELLEADDDLSGASKESIAMHCWLENLC